MPRNVTDVSDLVCEHDDADARVRIVRHYTRVTERAAVAKDYLICILSVNVPTKRLLIAGLNRPAIAQRDIYCRRQW